MILLFPLLACAQPKDGPPPDSKFSLTVYSTADPATFDPQEYQGDAIDRANRQPIPGFGVVREIRKIPLARGENTLRFTDVAAGIDPTRRAETVPVSGFVAMARKLANMRGVPDRE